MNVKLIADEFEFESQMTREENPDRFEELEVLGDIQADRDSENEYENDN